MDIWAKTYFVLFEQGPEIWDQILDLNIFTFPDSIKGAAVPRLNVIQSIQACSYCNSVPRLESLFLEQSQDLTFHTQS